MEVFLLLYSRAPPLNTGLSEAAHQASWLVTQPPLTTAPSLPLPGAASPWTRTQLFSHAKLIVLLHPKPSANSPPWGSKTRFHSTAQLSLSSARVWKSRVHSLALGSGCTISSPYPLLGAHNWLQTVSKLSKLIQQNVFSPLPAVTHFLSFPEVAHDKLRHTVRRKVVKELQLTHLQGLGAGHYAAYK